MPLPQGAFGCEADRALSHMCHAQTGLQGRESPLEIPQLCPNALQNGVLSFWRRRKGKDVWAGSMTLRLPSGAARAVGLGSPLR